MNRTFRKIKLKDENNFICEFTEFIELEDGRQVEYTDTKHITAQLHKDLRNAFKKLRVHFALISCQISDNLVSKDMFDDLNAYSLKELNEFICNQVILSGVGQDRTIQLAGRRIVKQGKVINWTTPAIKPSHEDDFYPYKVDLHNDVENALDEAEACLEGKYQEVLQTSLDLEGEKISMTENGAK